MAHRQYSRDQLQDLSSKGLDIPQGLAAHRQYSRDQLQDLSWKGLDIPQGLEAHRQYPCDRVQLSWKGLDDGVAISITRNPDRTVGVALTINVEPQVQIRKLNVSF